MSTLHPNPRSDDGYEIIETNDFLRRVEAVVGDIRHWDECDGD